MYLFYCVLHYLQLAEWLSSVEAILEEVDNKLYFTSCKKHSGRMFRHLR